MEHLTTEAEDSNLGKVNEFVHAATEGYDVPTATMMQIDLAVEELFVNISHYAYEAGPGTVDIDCGVDGGSLELTVRFSDSGVPFDPLSKEAPDTTLPAEKRGIGGLGIFLTRKYMDSVEYSRADERNVLTIRKSLRGAEI